MTDDKPIGQSFLLSPSLYAAVVAHKGRETWGAYVRRLIVEDVRRSGVIIDDTVKAQGRPCKEKA